MNEAIVKQILNEKSSPGTVCKLKSTFECLDNAKHFMDKANAVPGLIGHVQSELINDQLKYNVYLMSYNKFDKLKFKNFIDDFDTIEIISVP